MHMLHFGRLDRSRYSTPPYITATLQMAIPCARYWYRPSFIANAKPIAGKATTMPIVDGLSDRRDLSQKYSRIVTGTFQSTAKSAPKPRCG
jgi:hypothetical protein